MAVVIGWCTRTWRCLEALCSKGSFTEQDPGIAVLWAVLTRRATRWAVGQLRRERVSVLGLARQAQGDWKTVWRAVNPVLEEADADPVRFAGMRHLGGEHVWHDKNPRTRGPKMLTGIAVFTHTDDVPRARLLNLTLGRSGTVDGVWLP